MGACEQLVTAYRAWLDAWVAAADDSGDRAERAVRAGDPFDPVLCDGAGMSEFREVLCEAGRAFATLPALEQQAVRATLLAALGVVAEAGRTRADAHYQAKEVNVEEARRDDEAAYLDAYLRTLASVLRDDEVRAVLTPRPPRVLEADLMAEAERLLKETHDKSRDVLDKATNRSRVTFAVSVALAVAAAGLLAAGVRLGPPGNQLGRPGSGDRGGWRAHRVRRAGAVPAAPGRRPARGRPPLGRADARCRKARVRPYPPAAEPRGAGPGPRATHRPPTRPSV
jgi:hypothetical protein